MVETVFSIIHWFIYWKSEMGWDWQDR